jgi:hypothetical protein
MDRGEIIMTNKWKVEVNGIVFDVNATDSWCAVTRAIKGYWKHRGNKEALNTMRIYVEKVQ